MLAPCVNALQSTDKVSTTFTILQDLASVGVRRHKRFRGVGNVKQTEAMLVVSQNQITLPPVKYQVYPRRYERWRGRPRRAGTSRGAVAGHVGGEKEDLRAGAARRGGRQIGGGRARAQAQEAPRRGAGALS